MAGFLYFIDGWQNPITDDVIARSSLSYAFERSPSFAPIHGRTPSGGAGTLLGDKHRVDNLAFDAARQRWEKRPPIPGVEHSVYVGHWNDAPPSPRELERSKPITGETLLLADRRAWKIPRLLVHTDDSGFSVNLPNLVDITADGKLVPGDVVEEYRPAAALAERIFQALKYGCSSDEGIKLSAEVLAINYAVSLFEAVKLLRLFRDDDDNTLKAIIRSAANWPQFERWVEKKTAESTQTDSSG